MKNYFTFILLCLISIPSTGQNKNFSIEDRLVLWSNIYENSEKLTDVKLNPRLYFKTDSTGSIKKSLANKKLKDELTADFKIEFKDKRYKVRVFNIRFYNTTQITLYGVTTDVKDYGIENFLVKKRKDEFKTSRNAVRLTNLLNDYFIDLFSYEKNTKKNNW